MKKIQFYNNIFLYIFLLFVCIFLNFFNYDEALIYQRTLNYLKYNSFDLLDKFENPTFGRFFYYINSKIKNIENVFQSYFYLRLLSLLSVIGILFTGRLIIKKYYLNLEKYLFIFYLIILIWFGFFSGGITSRHDSVLSFCIFFSLLGCLQYFKYKKINIVFYSFFLSSLLFSLHPQFILPILLNFILIAKNIFETKNTRKNISSVLFIFLTFILMIKLLIFSELTLLNIQDFITKTKSHFLFLDNNSYKSDLNNFLFLLNVKRDLFGLERIHHLRLYFRVGFYLIFILFIIFLFCTYNYKDWSKTDRLVFVYLFLAFLFLLILPNKWAHHLSILMPLLSLFIFIFINIYDLKKVIDKISDYIFLITTLLILKLFLFNLSNNYFFYNFLKINSIKVENYIFFKNIHKNQLLIDDYNSKYKGFRFYGNPEMKYIFKNLIFETHWLDLVSTQKVKINLAILESRFFSNKCDFSNLKQGYLEKHGSFQIDGNDWMLCFLKK